MMKCGDEGTSCFMIIILQMQCSIFWAGYVFMKCTVYCGVNILSQWRNRKPQKQLEKENSRERGQPPHN